MACETESVFLFAGCCGNRIPHKLTAGHIPISPLQDRKVWVWACNWSPGSLQKTVYVYIENKAVTKIPYSFIRRRGFL